MFAASKTYVSVLKIEKHLGKEDSTAEALEREILISFDTYDVRL